MNEIKAYLIDQYKNRMAEIAIDCKSIYEFTLLL